jgi:hypothetical protein
LRAVSECHWPRGAVVAGRRDAEDAIDELLTAGHPVMLKQEYQAGGFGNEILSPVDGVRPKEPKDKNFPNYDNEDLILTSRFIDLNVFSINENTVMVNSAYPELTHVLEKHQLTVVPVRHRHRRLFGGGLHCFTLDTVREGSTPEGYLEL